MRSLEYEIAKYEGDLAHPGVYFPLPPAAVERKIDTLMGVFSLPAAAGSGSTRSCFARSFACAAWSAIHRRGMPRHSTHAS